MTSAEQHKKPMTITLDGPSGVGKGTIAQLLAQKLGFHLLDSGAIYRLAALASINAAIDVKNEADLAQLCKHLNIEFKSGPSGARVFLDQADVSQIIRTEAIAQRASQIAVISAVRQALLQRQRDFAMPPGLVADGRDMGTVVFPDASVKFFFTANAQIRAKRRYDQLIQSGQAADFDRVLSDIQVRDARDANRAVAPLKPAADAHRVDTSNLSVDEVFAQVLSYIPKSS